MSDSNFTPKQHRTVTLMILAVIIVFALLSGIVITSFQGWENPSPVATLPFTPQIPTSLPMPSPVLSPTLQVGLWPQVQAARLFDQIAHQVEIIRGLYPRAEVPLSFLDEREMTVLLRRLYIERGPKAHLFPYIVLGLLPDASISIHPHQVAGVYASEQEQLYVATGQRESSVDDQALLAHAYTHALQDQHFDLGAMNARATTTDATLAIRALVEGDATILAALYRYENLATADWEHLTGLILQAEQPDYGEELDRVEAWARLQRFPYWEGRQFTEALFQAGGWEAINRAYTDPPRSTEQVLHLERYSEERDVPAGVIVPDISAIVGEGWTMSLQDVLGEFVIGLYLDETLPGEVAWQAADGWDGDTFVAWEHEDGRRVIVWRTVWDTTAEAAEFEHALIALVPQRYLPALPVDPPVRLAGRWWETDAGAVYVYRVARYVTFVQAPDVNALANVVEVLP
ncbi:MAG: hypothetical protein SWK90_14170 [Chloroflexota bacterium]|nr:hypothetical protein [Chloroflexota bacterium]